MSGGNKLSFRSCQWRIIYHEIHGNGRLGNLLEGQWLRILLRTNGITHMQVFNTGYRNDISKGGLLHIHSL